MTIRTPSTNNSSDLAVLRNRTFDEIAVGDHASIERTLSAADIQLFAAIRGGAAPTRASNRVSAETLNQ